jgi:hypothetical protein
VVYPTSSETDSGWFHSAGGAGTVLVRVDAEAADLRVELRRGWRSAVGPELLARAVLEALHGALLARVAAEVQDWASHRLPTGSQLRPPDRRDRQGLSLRDAEARSQRAHRDLREFQRQLAALGRRRRTVSGPVREVLVVALGGQVVDLVLDPDWRRTAIDPDLERRITAALRNGLRECSALPARVLDGCPDLVEVLAASSGGPLFSVADQASAARRGAH